MIFTVGRYQSSTISTMNTTIFAAQVSGLEPIKFPPINPVTEDISRPFWSVMIPTYNGTKYLEQTLRSVLEQAPNPDEMQIEVIDDCSTQDDPEAIVRAIGQNRILFYRQPHNVGQIANWNTCIQRAHGRWVHILHQDDIVMSGFYSSLREALEKEPTIGAAFCRYIYMDEDSHWQNLSPLERRTPGILSDLLERLAVVQLIQFPSIVVRRNVYEEVGGFCPEACSAADWEMWKRIAAHYPIWYDPQVLACFRLHSASESSRLIKSGTNIADTRKAIEISHSYLPKAVARELSSKAKEHYALYAVYTAHQMLAMGDLVAARAQIREALTCSHSFKVIRSVIDLLSWAGMRWLWRTVRTKASFQKKA